MNIPLSVYISLQSRFPYIYTFVFTYDLHMFLLTSFDLTAVQGRTVSAWDERLHQVLIFAL